MFTFLDPMASNISGSDQKVLTFKDLASALVSGSLLQSSSHENSADHIAGSQLQQATSGAKKKDVKTISEQRVMKGVSSAPKEWPTLSADSKRNDLSPPNNYAARVRKDKAYHTSREHSTSTTPLLESHKPSRKGMMSDNETGSLKQHQPLDSLQSVAGALKTQGYILC